MEEQQKNKILNILEQVLKDYKNSETHSILFYSKNQPRDFKILEDKITDYKKKLKEVLEIK